MNDIPSIPEQPVNKPVTYTRSEFEKNKTERIKALCDLLSAVADIPESGNQNYGKSRAEQILEWIRNTIGTWPDQ